MSTLIRNTRPSSPLTLAGKSPVWLWRAVGLLLLTGLGIVAWEEGLKDRVRPFNWGVVEPGVLYRSGRLPEWRARQVLENHQIQVIVDLTLTDADNPAQRAEAAAVEELGIERHRFALRGDGTGDIRQYAQALVVMHHSLQEGRPVLVHCAGGAQRTGGAIAFYQMLVQQRPAAEVYADLRRHARTQPSDILVNYINSHVGELAGLLRQAGVLQELPASLPQLPAGG